MAKKSSDNSQKIVGTTEAAFLLGLCGSRVRQLLVAGRIKGARKVGRFWQIPLYQGMPRVASANKKPNGKWRQSPQRVATVIHVNQQKIRKNIHNHQSLEPVISIKQGKKDICCHEVEILGPSRLVYQPHNPIHCGARLWLEVDPGVKIIPRRFQSFNDLLADTLSVQSIHKCAIRFCES